MAHKEYTNGKVTVVWKSGQCIHSTKCFKGLPDVFDPNARPWVHIEGAETNRIVEQVNNCPSGALSYYMNDENTDDQNDQGEILSIEVTENGPLMIDGKLRVRMADGSIHERDKKTALCRCGGSQKKPFCDGSHRKNNFKG
ncbi:MAG: (4Fe-4S)-binding protein [Marinoscillum sp.]